MIARPPKWMDRILSWYCKQELLEDLQGDLWELYQGQVGKKTTYRNIRYFLWIIRSLRPSTIKGLKFKNSNNMTLNNFKIAGRILWKDRFNTGINLLGLSLGTVCFFLLGFYVWQELSYDHFHRNKDRLYRTWLLEDYGNGQTYFNSQVPFRFEELLEGNFPEIEDAIQLTKQNYLIGRGENRINESVSLISPEMFDVFDFKLLEGNTSKPLESKRAVIISDDYAKKYFGDSEPIGKYLGIQLDSTITDFQVTAVFEDMPVSSSIDFDIAISSDNNRDIFGYRAMNAWWLVAPEMYILIKEGATISDVESKIQDVVMSYLGEDVERDEYTIGFQPLTDIHLNPDIPLGYAPVANPQYVLILGIIGVLVLIIACINYTTLSIGQSLRRTKEVAMRKVLGATRGGLIFHYLAESALVTSISLLIGVFLAISLIPTFNRLTGTEILLTFEWWHLSVYVIVGLLIALLAGAYPAFVLSAQKSLSMFRGSGFHPKNQLVRNGMVLFQFMITVFLISSTLIMRDQVNYLQNKNLGYQHEAVVSVKLFADPGAQRTTEIIETGFDNGELLKARLSQYPEVSKIGMGTHVFGTPGWASLAYTQDDGTFRRFSLLIVDPYYFQTFNIKMKEGRAFDPESALDQRQSVIINESAADYFGYSNAVGEKLPGNKEFGDHQIIGVTNNFHFSSLHQDIEPLIIVQNPLPIFQGVSDGDFRDSLVPKLVFTYTGSNLLYVREILEENWSSSFPNESLQFDFVSEQISALYESEARMNKLVVIATILSILIAILGLLGLTVITANSRIKEIGIRKIMGADTLSIFSLLSKKFIVLLVIGTLASVPITIFIMRGWLENFAYHVEIGFIQFVLGATLSIVIAGIVILYHTIRTVRVNPISSLRDE